MVSLGLYDAAFIIGWGARLLSAISKDDENYLILLNIGL